MSEKAFGVCFGFFSNAAATAYLMHVPSQVAGCLSNRINTLFHYEHESSSTMLVNLGFKSPFAQEKLLLNRSIAALRTQRIKV